jgi:archaeal flagellar protein FlaH
VIPDIVLAQQNLLISGIGEIDKKLGGGLPTGSLTLMEGESDAGKTPMVQQFIHGCLEAGKRVALYTTENTTSSLMRQMKSLNMDVDDYFILGRLSIYPLPLVIEPDNSRTMYATFIDHMRSLDVDVIFIDGVTAFVSHAEEGSTLDFFFATRDLCDSGFSVVMTLHSYACREELLLRLLSLCDAHLRLKVEDLGKRLCKTMEIAKIRGAARSGGAFSVCFEVVPDLGITIIPVFKAKL